MTADTEVGRHRIAGRRPEQRLLADLLQAAVSGEPSAAFVHGEAGVGKTRLVQALCAQAEADGYGVLWGRCVRFGAATSPYAPIRHALAGRKPDEAAELDGVVDASGRALLQLERSIVGIAAERPTVLVVDDLQWADVSSLDLIAYLVAGFHRERLLVLATFRDELEDGHPLHGWLADVLRLPGVHDLPLSRLTEEETAEQIALLTGGVSDVLLGQVYARSLGNAYLTELLVQNLSPGAERLPRDLPRRLRQVLLASWHRLSPHAREVMRVLAVGGEPMEYVDLVHVVEELGVDADHVAPSLTESAAAGVVHVVDDGRYWFRHPLLAEVLMETFAGGEAVPYHAAYVTVLQRLTQRDDRDRVRHLATLGLHQERCGRPDAAFACLEEAARLAREVQGFAEQARHLYRMVDLAPFVEEGTLAAAGGLTPLLERAALVARNRGELPISLRFVSQALARVDRQRDPLTASRLVMLSAQLTMHSGQVARWPLDLAEDAVALSSVAPDSAEHAAALAQLSFFEAWSSLREQAVVHAGRALEAATRSGSPGARAQALGARSFARIRDETSLTDGEEAYRLAREAGDPFRIAEVTVDRLNTLGERGRLQEYVMLAAEGFAVATASGVREFTGVFAGLSAIALLELGRIDEAAAWVREGLAARSQGHGGIFARLAAATWSTRTGRLDDADEHLRRARELAPDLLGSVGLQALTPVAEQHLARGRPEQALEVLLAGVPVHGMVDPRYADELLVWGARAAADLAERARLAGVPPSVDPEAAVAELVALRAGCPGEPFEPVDEGDQVPPAQRALFEAEHARCRRDPDAAAAWDEAARRCAEASLAWERAVALRRSAEARLSAGGSRTAAARALREAHEITAGSGALPLQAEVEALARAARISLAAPSVPVASNGGPRPGSLTARESEVLAHLVAGRSYAEIADALFISQKTVSVHVSNLLRKTGTRNRAEAAAFARHHDLLAHPDSSA